MLFLGPLYDFWIPEINTKFIEGDWTGLHHGEFRYYDELQKKFLDLTRVIIYCVSFVFLSLHLLLRGFQSSFQSKQGFNHNKYTPTIKKLEIYIIIIPVRICVYRRIHYFVQFIKSLINYVSFRF